MCRRVGFTTLCNAEAPPADTKQSPKILEVRIEEASGCNKESVPCWGPDIKEGFVKGALLALNLSTLPCTPRVSQP